MTTETKCVARKRRKVLGWYIDFVLFFALCMLMGYWCGLSGSALWLMTLPFMALEFVVVRAGWSPGYYFLSIGRAAGDDGKPVAMVDPDIKSQEHWLTILVGVLLILDGTKEMVRWTQGLPVMPVMGVRLDFVSGAVYSVVCGLLSVYTGYCVLKLKRQAVWIVLGFLVYGGVSMFLSWPLMFQAIEEMVVKRREIQGLPVRNGEVVLAQRMIGPFAIVNLVAVGAFLAFFRKRFTRRGIY